MIAKSAAVLTAVLPSALVKAENMEPVKFVFIASADWDVVAIEPRSSASASSIERSLTRTPAPVMVLEGSKCWTPSRWIVTISNTSVDVLRGCDMALSRATRFTEAWVAGIDAIVRGEGNRAIVSASGDLDIAGDGCTTRCLQRGEQRTKASPRILAISYSVSDSEGCFELALVAFDVDLDPVFLLPRFGERWYRSLESSQSNTPRKE